MRKSILTDTWVLLDSQIRAHGFPTCSKDQGTLIEQSLTLIEQSWLSAFKTTSTYNHLVIFQCSDPRAWYWLLNSRLKLTPAKVATHSTLLLLHHLCLRVCLTFVNEQFICSYVSTAPLSLRCWFAYMHVCKKKGALIPASEKQLCISQNSVQYDVFNAMGTKQWRILSCWIALMHATEIGPKPYTGIHEYSLGFWYSDSRIGARVLIKITWSSCMMYFSSGRIAKSDYRVRMNKFLVINTNSSILKLCVHLFIA